MADEQRSRDHIWDAVIWWEMRRIPYNVAVGATGLVSLPGWLIFSSIHSGIQYRGDWRLMLILIVGYGIMANIGYTLGAILELAWVHGGLKQRLAFRHRYYQLDLRLSCVVVSLPMWFAVSECILDYTFQVSGH